MSHRQILAKLKVAKSAEEIAALLAASELFENAKWKTRARWKRAAEKRRKELVEEILSK
jgi:hypothetical protein